MTIESFSQQVYPNLGTTALVGYNGTAPGPTYMVERGHETVVRVYNQGSGNSAMHLHGSYTHAPWDGWAEDYIEVGQWKDYYYPNSENGRAIWYHDHVHGSTASDTYFGQVGVYIIYDPAEDALGLPSGDYDVPLAISDKVYQSSGALTSPNANSQSFYGDIIHVNNQPWPYMSTEPRKYRLRFYDMSISRPYDLYFQDESGNKIEFQVIASDSGLFGAPVSSNDVTIATGERYEVVIDFSAYSGQNLTLMNGNTVFPGSVFANTNQVMRFVVGTSVSDSSNNGNVPGTLNPSILWPPARTTVDHTFAFRQGGDAAWTINGIGFDDVNNRILAKPPQGTVELWQLVHASGPVAHPVHIHLINMQIVSRTGGSNRGLLPYEKAGLKDTVLLEPGETVEVLAYYSPWDGIYMFHCHNLIHEDNAMMAVMNVTLLQQLGYDFNSTLGFVNPDDPRFIAQAYSDDDFTPDAVSSAVVSLAGLNAYQAASSIMAAESAFYATAAYLRDTTYPFTPTSTATSVASSTTPASTTPTTTPLTSITPTTAPTTQSTTTPTTTPNTTPAPTSTKTKKTKTKTKTSKQKKATAVARAFRA